MGEISSNNESRKRQGVGQDAEPLLQGKQALVDLNPRGRKHMEVKILTNGKMDCFQDMQR